MTGGTWGRRFQHTFCRSQRTAVGDGAWPNSFWCQNPQKNKAQPNGLTLFDQTPGRNNFIVGKNKPTGQINNMTMRIINSFWCQIWPAAREDGVSNTKSKTTPQAERFFVCKTNRAKPTKWQSRYDRAGVQPKQAASSLAPKQRRSSLGPQPKRGPMSRAFNCSQNPKPNRTD